jgi:hypothetical protein
MVKQSELENLYFEIFKAQGYEDKYAEQMSHKRAVIETEFIQDPKTTKGTKVRVSQNPQQTRDAMHRIIALAEVMLEDRAI